MEIKLSQYRAAKRREGIFIAARTLFSKKERSEFVSADDMDVYDPTEDDGPMFSNQRLITLESEADLSEDYTPRESWWNFAFHALYILLWVTLYAIAIYVEFGTVYFMLSLLYVIWMNTRSDPKKQGEISAYSVFNPNCESIDGTLKAEQFEKEIRFGAGSVR